MTSFESAGNRWRSPGRQLTGRLAVFLALLPGFSWQVWAQRAPIDEADPSKPILRTEAYWQYELAHRAIYGEALPARPDAPGDRYAALNAERFQQAASVIKDRQSTLGVAKAVPFVGVVKAGREGLPETIALALHQLHVQAEVVRPSQDFSRVPLLILGGIEDLPEADWPRVESYVRNGGILLTSIANGMAAKAMWRYWGDPLWRRTFSLFGFHVVANSIAGTNGYLQLDPSVRHVAIDRGCLIKGPFWEVLGPDDQKLGQLILPWQNMSYGFAYMQAPPDHPDVSPGATLSAYGKGKAVFVTLPIFYSLQETGFTCIQDILLDLINFLLPAPPFKLQAPPNVECSLMSRQNAMLLNLLYYYPNRAVTPRLDIEDSVPLRNLSVSVRTGDRPQVVRLQPGATPLKYDFLGGYTTVEIPALTGWQILELSLAQRQ